MVLKGGANKKNDPNLYDLSAYGNVVMGEEYKKAAERELLEELDMKCELKLLDKYYQEIKNDDKISKIFCAVFLGISDQVPKLNHELSEFKWMSFNEIENEIKEKPEIFCQGFRNDFLQVKDKLISQFNF